MTTLANFVNHSGGAIGSDIAWERFGKPFGMVTNRHYYYGAKTHYGNTLITKEQMLEGWQRVLKANVTLLRRPENYRDLLSRNWMQVKHASAIYAIGLLQNPRIVNGGTGWAVQMAIDERKPVYLFNLDRRVWYLFDYEKGLFVECDTPILTRQFAGIGTRGLTVPGERAIFEVYRKTVANEDLNNSMLQ